MATSITIDLTDKATPRLTRLNLALQPEEVGGAIGPAVVNRMREHFFRLNRERPNKLGGKRSNFFNQAARGTHFKVHPSEVTINVNQVGLRQRLQGGVIKPTGARKYLTLPATAAAYGTRAREWHTLVFGFATYSDGSLRPALVEADRTDIRIGRTRKDGTRKIKATPKPGGGAIFWLVRSVNQPPDPTVIPTDEQIREAALQGVTRYFELQAKRKGGGE